MRLTYREDRFIFLCDFASRLIARDNLFKWDSNRRHWYTENPGIASRLKEYADVSAKKEIHRQTLVKNSWQDAIPVPHGLKPYPFQIKAVHYALSRNRSYLALDPGLGKTICAALIANALKLPIHYICPPFLVENVLEEFDKWADPNYSMFIRADSRLSDYPLQPGIHNCVLFVDEAHRFKNDKAKRTKALMKLISRFERVVFLSGTPMPNRPMELYPILSTAAPSLINHQSKFEYGRKYCAGHLGRWGWDFSGASNLKELADKISGDEGFMHRVKKKDVLPELPPKLEEMVVINDTMNPELIGMNAKLLKTYSPEDLMKGIIGEEHVSSYRRALGEAKVEAALTFLEDLLENSEEKILVFAIHKQVIADLHSSLSKWNPLFINGEVPANKRHFIVKEFQEGNSRVLILNIQAGGVGFNLTAATRVVFVEFSWVPSDNDQAGDRAHRIGQEEPVTVQYLVYKDSIDKAVMETIFRKKKITGYF